MSVDPLSVAVEVASILERLSVPYLVGGSLASTLYGEPRATLDVDFALHLDPDRCEQLCDALQPDFYVDRSSIHQASREGGLFNAIRLGPMVKVDFYARPRAGIHAEEIRRAIPTRLRADSQAIVRVATPEDTVLQKLLWYQSGGSTSDRQWRDVLGVLKGTASRLDLNYLQRWASELGLKNLLQKAQEESGLAKL